MAVLVAVHAAASRPAAAAGAAFLRWAFLLAAGYAVLTLFVRRIGGPDAGSERIVVGVSAFLAAIVVGVLVATKR